MSEFHDIFQMRDTHWMEKRNRSVIEGVSGGFKSDGMDLFIPDLGLWSWKCLTGSNG
jgi:hypothetical protein